MAAWMLPLIGAAIGLAKSQYVDRPVEEKDRELQAATARFSPWTGLAPRDVKRADPFGSVLQGGMTGLQMDQSMTAADQWKQQTAAMRAQNAAQQGMTTSAGGAGGYNLGVQLPQGYTQSMNPYLGMQLYR